jgi:hypothetical protein
VKGAGAWISVPGAMAASQAFTRDFSFSMELVTSRLHHFSLTNIVKQLFREFFLNPSVSVIQEGHLITPKKGNIKNFHVLKSCMCFLDQLKLGSFSQRST